MASNDGATDAGAIPDSDPRPVMQVQVVLERKKVVSLVEIIQTLVQVQNLHLLHHLQALGAKNEFTKTKTFNG